MGQIVIEYFGQFFTEPSDHTIVSFPGAQLVLIEGAPVRGPDFRRGSSSLARRQFTRFCPGSYHPQRLLLVQVTPALLYNVSM